MNQDIIKIVTTFGIVLVENQHKHFVEQSIDDSEHIPAIGRIAYAAYQYLKANGISIDNSAKVKEELILYGKDLFIQLWMKYIIENGDIPNKNDIREAEKTFEKILKTCKD